MDCGVWPNTLNAKFLNSQVGFISVGIFLGGYFLSKIKCVFFPWFCSEIRKAKYCLNSESKQVKIHPLADGGMVLGLGFHYQVCDVNSMYVFTADLCSLIRRGGIFAFKESQVQNLLIINTINFYSPSANCVSEKFNPITLDVQKWGAKFHGVEL